MALSQNPKNRPQAKEFRRMIQRVHDNLGALTRDRQHLSSEFVLKEKLFADRRFPEISKEFPEFNKK